MSQANNNNNEKESYNPKNDDDTVSIEEYMVEISENIDREIANMLTKNDP